jgi:hypothetical protein
VGFAPVVVNVPSNTKINITMEANNWAFGKVTGASKGAK